jgi:hypothetical protein
LSLNNGLAGYSLSASSFGRVWGALLIAYHRPGVRDAWSERVRFRHGVGEREVYGRRPPAHLTFVQGHAVVEGVPADD